MKFEFSTTAYFSEFKQGELLIRNRMLLQQECEKSGLKEFEVIVKSRSKSRSSQQNRYYWTCVTIVANELGYSKEEMHSIIGYKFLRREIVSDKTGEVFEYIKSTTKLTTTEFVVFVDELIKWSAESLSIVLPLPNQQLTF